MNEKGSRNTMWELEYLKPQKLVLNPKNKNGVEKSFWVNDFHFTGIQTEY